MRGIWIGFFLLSVVAMAKTHKVREGHSIQKTIDKAKAGDTIEVFAGDYKESLVIDKPNIKLMGRIHQGRWPVLDGEGKRNDGVIASGSGFHIENFHIQNYRGNGVMTQGADHVVMRKLIVKNTGIYGIYPTRGDHIVVEDTVSSGIADAAIYVGMCNHVDVRRNEVYENVAGIEIENSHHVLVEGNIAHHNSGGILLFTLPGLPVKTGYDAIVRNNLVYENNHKNFAHEGAIVASVPPGTGILLLAADKVRIENNVIRDNSTAGLVFGDLSFISDSAAPDPEVEPNSDNNEVLNNTFFHNGFKPQGMVRYLLMLKHVSFSGSDILAAGSGKNNCIAGTLGGAKKLGTSKFKTCDSKLTTKNIVSMVGDKPTLFSHAESTEGVGARIYATVCSGCHAMGMRRIGPAVGEIQVKYKANPEGIVSFAKKPKRIRPGYPEMPPQTYLGDKKLAEVAKYMLEMK